MYLWRSVLWLATLQTALNFDLHDNVLDELTAYASKEEESQIHEEAGGYWNLISNLLLELASTIGVVASTGSDQLETSSNQMEDSARMLETDYQSAPVTGNVGYHTHMPIQPLSGYGYQQQQMDMDYGTSQHGYMQAQQDGYGSQQQTSGYEMKGMRKKGYKKTKKVYVPIVIRKKKQKKMKTVSVFKGFYIPGGSQVFGKFKKLADCKKSCGISPTCFSADYNPWLKKCYHHNNLTACSENMRTHPKLIHFKKVPCDVLETPRGVLTLGTHIFGGLEQKGIKSLQDCIKKCANAGQGIAPNQDMINMQTCFAIDYDFATHKCYFHTDSDLCTMVVGTPPSLSPKPSSINLLMCPFQT